MDIGYFMNNMENLSIGTKIKHVRELRNYTQEFMDDMLQISQSTYARYEKESGDLTISKLQKIVDILEVKIEDLINFNDQFIFNIARKSTTGYIVNHINENEKKLYEDKIKLLEDKIAYLEKHKNKK